MIITFPLLSFGLCAWMTVFGFYLKLEESAWVRIRRKKKREKLEKILTSDWIKSHSKDDLTEVRRFLNWRKYLIFISFSKSMYDLCSGSLEQSKGKLPQHKSLEEILKQELAWTLEQVGSSGSIEPLLNMTSRHTLESSSKECHPECHPECHLECWDQWDMVRSNQ